MEEPTRTAAEQEQHQVRMAALSAHMLALVVAAILVGAQWWTLAAAVAVIAAVAGAWALRLYGDLQAQALHAASVAAASRRFERPDEFER